MLKILIPVGIAGVAGFFLMKKFTGNNNDNKPEREVDNIERKYKGSGKETGSGSGGSREFQTVDEL